MRDHSMRWLKNLVLVKYGLRTLGNLNESVKRYGVHNYHKMFADITNDFTLLNNPDAIRCIIKLVPLNSLFKLPNIKINSVDEIHEAENSFLKSNLNMYHEFWYCKTVTSKNKLMFSGRINFPVSYHSKQVFEFVFNDIPRAIDKYGNNADINYIRASRFSWGMRYCIEEMRLSESKSISAEALLKYFHYASKLAEGYRNIVGVFEDDLRTAGIRNFTLEFMFNGNRFSFIDWDSDNDIYVVQKLYNEEIPF